jgi:hypothetical protein
MTATPVFTQTPREGIGQISTANTNRDGSGTIGTIFSAGASGSRVDKIAVKGVGTTTAGMVRLYIHDGSNARLWREYQVAAITPGASTKTWEVEESFPGGVPLPSGYSIRASTHNAETFNVIASGWDY